MLARNLLILLLLIIIGASGYLIFNINTPSVRNDHEGNIELGREEAQRGSLEKFNYLVRQTSNNCGLQRQTVLGYLDTQHIQGSCCSKMDYHAYQEQIKALKEYKDISIIPSDPYDLSAAQAKQLFTYFDEIKLTADQQNIYNEAMKMSHEGGPCCCKCWHWDAYEGLAKKLIVDYGWGEKQIAHLWDISDACGGEGDHINHA